MPERKIISRRICEKPSARCFRGQCILCNKAPMVSIEEVERTAVNLGYNKDFIAGRINDFLHAEVMWEV